MSYDDEDDDDDDEDDDDDNDKSTNKGTKIHFGLEEASFKARFGNHN